MDKYLEGNLTSKILKVFPLLGLALFLYLTIPSILGRIYPSQNAPVNESNAVVIDSIYLDTTYIQIGFVGDIMTHLTQLNAQKQEDGSYDFTNNYKWMAPLFQQNDIMIGNLETTFAGEKVKFSAYPRFNTPDELANALAQAGFHVISTANNHMYDKGANGLYRTIDILENQSLLVTGSRRSNLDKRYVVKSINGTKVGIIAYTYESGRLNGDITINGIKINAPDTIHINTFDPDNLGPTVAELRQEMTAMKNDSVDITIAVMHWGYEYKTKPNTYQIALADSLNKLQFDVVLGSHPHVVQPADILQDSLSNHMTYVLYSAGNFISNQRYETLKNSYTEDGVYTTIKFRKISDAKPEIIHIAHHPTWVHRYRDNSNYVYEVVPVHQVLLDDSLSNSFSTQQLERMKQSAERTQSIVKSLVLEY